MAELNTSNQSTKVVQTTIPHHPEMGRLNNVFTSIKEIGITLEIDELVIRNAEEFLLIRTFRDIKMKEMKKRAEEMLKKTPTFPVKDHIDSA